MLFVNGYLNDGEIETASIFNMKSYVEEHTIDSEQPHLATKSSDCHLYIIINISILKLCSYYNILKYMPP